MILGKELKTKENVSINLKNLIKTRLLISANSGGGKSWTMRRLMEQTYDKVKHIIIDIEGEFTTLKEKFPYTVYNEKQLQPETANKICLEILKENSAILDLSELESDKKLLFVKNFINALIQSKPELWQPILIFIDEAHQFIPQGKKVESSEAIINLSTRGRKRGFCTILCTQRLSKLHKDAAAEQNNKIMGRCALDIDRKRTAEELGLTTKESERKLRQLNEGEFYVFGPAISNEVRKIKIGGVQTTHQEPPLEMKVSKILKNQQESTPKKLISTPTILIFLGFFLFIIGERITTIFGGVALIMGVLGILKQWWKN